VKAVSLSEEQTQMHGKRNASAEHWHEMTLFFEKESYPYFPSPV
jgi:hypothetical protein